MRIFSYKSLLLTAITAAVLVSGYDHTAIVHSLSGLQAAIEQKSPTAAPDEGELKLQSQITALTAQYPSDTVSVSLINLGTNKQYDIGSTQPMLGASTTKIIVAADYLTQVEEGNASLSQSLDDSGDSAQNLLQTMIEENDIDASNDAWQDFIDNLTLSQIADYGQSIGLTSYNASENSITAHDEAIILQKLYDGELLNSENTQLLLGYLQNSAGQDLIPAALPTGAVVYHKYGFIYGYLHDAAIIKYQGKAFVLVIYTNNVNGTLADNTSREQLIQAITKATLAYEN